MAPRAWPSVIRTNVRTRPEPRLRATSSWPGSAPRRLAATGRYTSGYTASVMTMTAPRKPWIHVHSDAQPKLTTKSGMASGTTTSTAQIFRPGTLVRSTHQAAAVPITAHRAVTTTVSRTVFHSSSPVSGRAISRQSAAAPLPLASISRKTRGRARTAAISVAAAVSARGRRPRRAFFSATKTVPPAPGCPGPGPWRSRTGDDVIGILQAGAGRAARKARAARGSQQPRPAEQGDGRRPGAQLAERDRIRLELAQRDLRGRGGHARGYRVLVTE